MNRPISFLIVDDEEALLLTLKSYIKRSFPAAEIDTAEDGLEAFNKIKENHPQIIICDYDIPRLNGLDLCRRVRAESIYNDIYFIALTANNDGIIKNEILQAGADDYINKPFNTEEFVYRLRSASRFISMQDRLAEENQLLHDLANELESTIKDLKNFGYNLIHARIPNSIAKMHNVGGISIWMGKQLNELDEAQMADLEIAASLCDCGKISLPDNLVNLPVVLDGQPTDALMAQVPQLSRDILAKINRYKGAADILYHLYENFDGTGFPDKLQSWQIPLASRIIRVVSDYLDLLILKKPQNEAIQTIQKASKKLYDNRAVTLLEQFLALNAAREAGVKEKAVKLHELKDGMVISRDIITNSGLKLIPAGAILRDKSIKAIITHNTTDAIIGDIYVKD